MASTLQRGASKWGIGWSRHWAKTLQVWWHALRDAASDPADIHTTAFSRPDNMRNLAPAISEEPEFARFFMLFEQPVYGYVRRMVASDEIAVDVTQETFFRAWQHFAQLHTYTRPQAWLYHVATHLALNLRRERTIPFSQLFARRHDENDEISAETQFADPLDLEAQTIARDAIARALATLTERDRAVLLLRAVHDLTFDEIGAALELSPVAARKVLSRARERFRVALAGMEDP